MKNEYLSLDDILSADDVQYEVIEAFGGKVRVGSLSAEQMIQHAERMEGPTKRNAGVLLVLDSLVDAKGERIGDPAKLAALKKKSSVQLDKVVHKILKLNGMTKKAQEAMEQDAKKDSGEEAHVETPTSSPSSSASST